jgi:hypothetical protein
MNQTTFYEAFAACNPFTGLLERWMGTATLETIRRHGLFADLSYPLHGDEAQHIDHQLQTCWGVPVEDLVGHPL